VRGSRTDETVSAVGCIVGDPVGTGYSQQVRRSLVLEEVSLREKSAVVANLSGLGGASAPPAAMVHGGADQDDNYSESPQLKDPPERLQAMSDWWDKRDWVDFKRRVDASKKVAPPCAAGPKKQNLPWEVHLVVPIVS